MAEELVKLWSEYREECRVRYEKDDQDNFTRLIQSWPCFMDWIKTFKLTGFQKAQIDIK